MERLGKDYLAGRKDRYNKNKQQPTDMLIDLVEKQAISGLSMMIIMSDSATPLTNFRFTLNTAGSLYGYNQSTERNGQCQLVT
ncbi:hypothetical protein [Desulfovibrio sp. TomC]|uniref:hypothetical protein n=1 Tax=Desulfovibrio sp. TomC TaxID=1562888 RepID=UPI0005BA5EA9|nr:hypothetical protein [Desulfovibrio sp. TomC]